MHCTVHISRSSQSCYLSTGKHGVKPQKTANHNNVLAVNKISNVTPLYQLNSVQAFGSAMEVREGYLKITTGQIIMSLSRQATYA
jgi:hypothetical protein